MGSEILKNNESLTDNCLISYINSGKYEYLTQLINRYMPYIIKISDKYRGSGIDVEDLIQEGTLALFFAVKSYDQTKSSFSSFASICINRSIVSSLRSYYAAHHVPENLISPLDDVVLFDDNSPENILIEKEAFDSFADTIKKNLSKLEYNVFYEFLSGSSYAEISDKLNITVKSVDNALKRIRIKLKK